jgi:ABC-type dipeptide/oligopeptide/nickel transport system permease component
VSIGHYPDQVGTTRSRLPASLLLGGSVVIFNFTIGVWLGVVQAASRPRSGSFVTRLSLRAAMRVLAGADLISFVSLRWGWLPAAQMSDPLLPPDAPSTPRPSISPLVLPVTTLAVITLAGDALQQTVLEACGRTSCTWQSPRAQQAAGGVASRLRNAVFPY